MSAMIVVNVVMRHGRARRSPASITRLRISATVRAGRDRMRAGLQYVVMNLAGSTLFLFALGTLYASTGTLNIADLAARVAEMPPENTALVRVAAILLMIVFALKAALFPVQFWLPGTYANAPAPVAALFAIMTKVGAYAILRVHTTAFGPGVPGTEGLIGSWLFPAAIVTTPRSQPPACFSSPISS